MKERPVVSCSPAGRLGNNMFQVAAVLGYAAKHGTHDAVFMPGAFGQYDQSIFSRLRYSAVPQEWLIVRDAPDFAFNDQIQASPDRSVLFSGFMQSEKYFAHCRDLIRDTFAISMAVKSALYREFPAALLAGAVAMHVRRGDFLMQTEFHPVQTAAYYMEALQYLDDRVPVGHVLCCSDDPGWCRNHLAVRDSRIHVVHDQGDYLDLALMTLCQHHILSCSSFSWWSAWLGGHAEKIVIVPDRYLGPGFVNYSERDVLPDTWTRFCARQVTVNSAHEIHSRGYWLTADANDHHAFDAGLCSELISVLKEEGGTVADFGCGPGHYVRSMRDAGLTCDGFDGNPQTELFTSGLCQVLDLSDPVTLPNCYDWVVSLEVGEHIPPSFEATFIDNLHRHNTRGIILSWAVEGQSGHGHVNERTNESVRDDFRALGYRSDMLLERRLRESITTCGWFRNTIMVFRR